MDLTNHFLIAMPDMQDNFFAESVVYVCSYSAEGCMGVIINKPSPLPLRQILSAQQHAEPQHLFDDYIFLGGPVQVDRGFVLHSPAGNWMSSIVIGDNLALLFRRYPSPPARRTKREAGYAVYGLHRLECRPT